MRYFPMVALLAACVLAGASIFIKDKDGLAFASGVLALAGTAYQASASPEKRISDESEDSPN